MRKLLALVLALVLLLPCAACGRAEEPEGLQLYFVTQTREHGQVLESQPYAGPDQPGPEELLRALLAGPDREGLVSPFCPSPWPITVWCSPSASCRGWSRWSSSAAATPMTTAATSA